MGRFVVSTFWLYYFINLDISHVYLFPLAEAPKFAQPKLLVDEEVPQFNYDENWDDMVGPTFNPDKLISEAKYMT